MKTFFRNHSMVVDTVLLHSISDIEATWRTSLFTYSCRSNQPDTVWIEHTLELSLVYPMMFDLLGATPEAAVWLEDGYQIKNLTTFGTLQGNLKIVKWCLASAYCRSSNALTVIFREEMMNSRLTPSEI